MPFIHIHFRHIYILYGLNMNSNNNHLADDLIAQLRGALNRQCRGQGSNPVQA